MATRIDHVIAWADEDNEERAKLVASTKPVYNKISLEEYETRSYQALEPEFNRNPKRILITKQWVETAHDQLSREMEARKQRLLKDNAIPIDVILERWGEDQTIINMSRGRLSVFLGNEIIKTLNDPFTLLAKDQITTMESDAQFLFRWATCLPDAPKDIEKTLKKAQSAALARSQKPIVTEAVRKVLGGKKPVPNLLTMSVGSSKAN